MPTSTLLGLAPPVAAEDVGVRGVQLADQLADDEAHVLRGRRRGRAAGRTSRASPASPGRACPARSRSPAPCARPRRRSAATRRAGRAASSRRRGRAAVAPSPPGLASRPSPSITTPSRPTVSPLAVDDVRAVGRQPVAVTRSATVSPRGPRSRTPAASRGPIGAVLEPVEVALVGVEVEERRAVDRAGRGSCPRAAAAPRCARRCRRSRSAPAARPSRPRRRRLDLVVRRSATSSSSLRRGRKRGPSSRRVMA